MAQGTFDMHSVIDVVLERECHHEGEQAQVPRKCRRLASNSGRTLLCRHNLFTKNSEHKEHISVPSDQEQVQWHRTSLKLSLKRKLGKNKEMLTEANYFC